MNILDRFRRRKRTNERKSEIRNFCNTCLFRYSLLSKTNNEYKNHRARGSFNLDPSDGCLFVRLRSEISINIYKMPIHFTKNYDYSLILS